MLLFDEQLISRRFGLAARHYDAVAGIQQEMIQQALSMLNSYPISPDIILDIGCGTGNAFYGLTKKYPNSHKLAIDIAEPMLQVAQKKHPDWQLICTNMMTLPFKNAYSDFMFSTAALQWANDTVKTLAEWYRVLRPGGYLCLGTFGENTLSELKHAFRAVDDHPHVHTFLSAAQLQNLIDQVGFVTIHKIQYDRKMYHSTFFEILHYLKTIGATLAAPNRRTALTGKKRFQQAAHAYEQYREAEGLPASWEIILLLLRKPEK